MPRVPFRSLFHQKLGPYIQACRSQIDLETVYCSAHTQCQAWLMTSVIAGMKSFGIIPTEFIGSVVERGSGAKYNPKLTNLQCLRKQNLGLSTQGKTIVNGGRKKRDLSSTTQCFLIILQRNTLLSPGTAPPLVPIWGLWSPWGPKWVFWSPFGPNLFSKSPFSPFQT